MKFKINYLNGETEIVEKDSFSAAWEYAMSKSKRFSIESVNE
jgi:hypothetical protein